MVMTTQDKLNKLFAELGKVQHELSMARTELNECRRRETEAINVYNNTTKEIDQLLVDLRANAPQGSDWSIHLARAERTRQMFKPGEGGVSGGEPYRPGGRVMDNGDIEQ